MLPSILCCSSHKSLRKTNSMVTNPFACSVLIGVDSRENEKKIRKAIAPLMTWIDPSSKLIQVFKTSKQSQHCVPDYSEPAISPPTLTKHKRRLTQTFRIPCPAVSIMLFLQENGILGSKEIQKAFNHSPWRLHHRIELVNIHSPAQTLADQRFYQTHADTPLWAVCPIDAGREHLRINIFVRNFSAMIEFYRVLTGVEMETNKENFCWFQLYSQPGLEIRLSLKYVDNVDPYPLRTVQLLFNAKNVRYIKAALGVEMKPEGSDCYLLTDPDGNSVILHAKENTVAPFYAGDEEQFLCRKNHSRQFRNNLVKKCPPPDDLGFQKFSTLPRNFAYTKKDTNSSDKYTNNIERSYGDDFTDPFVFFTLPTKSNPSRQQQRYTDDHRHEISISAEDISTRRSRFSVNNRQRDTKHLSFRSDNGYVCTNKETFSDRVDYWSKQRQARINSSSLGSTDYRNPPRIPPPVPLRRSHSAIIDFSKYVIPQPVFKPNHESAMVSEEIFV